jgi:electron transport complex protein RnfB
MNATSKIGRRDFMRVAATVAASGAAWAVARRGDEATVWQLDPAKCVQCGRCATNCVLNPSAVKCVHSFQVCGYCDLCGGYLQPGAKARDTGAENELCPVGAITRTFIEEPFYQYTIDEKLCIGCGKCVKGCNVFGNGSLYLQVKHDLCVGCNECSIGRNCPAKAYQRVPVRAAYLLKTRDSGSGKHG